MVCENCGKEFFEDWRKDKEIRKKPCRFCSRSCSNTKIHSKETKRKISVSINKRNITDGAYREPKFCQTCKKELSTGCKGKLCRECYRKKIKKPYDKRSYKYQCRFKFNVYEYPERFNLNLIEENGWYKPTNYFKPNLGGVSLDHMFSVNEAYKNKIDVNIVSHPANCKILLQSENSSKSFNSSITLGELKERIRNWQ